METTRLILVLSLTVLTILLWQFWQQDYGRGVASVSPAPTSNSEEPEGGRPSVPELPGAQPAASVGPAPAAAAAAPADERISIQTDVLRLEIGARGAGIRRAELLRYPVALDKPSEPFVLLNDTPPDFYVTQGGLLSRQAAPTDDGAFVSNQPDYSLPPGVQTLQVPFTWTGGGITVRKVYELQRGSYVIEVRYEVENRSSSKWEGWAYSQIQRNDPGRTGRRLVYTYVGAVLSAPGQRYQKIDFKKMRTQKLGEDITGGWAAMLQHYFIAALIPADPHERHRFYTWCRSTNKDDTGCEIATSALQDERFAIGIMSSPRVIEDGGSGLFSEQIYIGPKLQNVMKNVADGLDLTVDYGKLWFIAKPLYWCLEQLRKLTDNWGWAIILVTVFLKLLFYPLSAAGYRSMANMRRVQPRLLAIRDRYKNDRARLNQAMMQIYKEEKINPFGGCFPIVIQIPVFISLYWVLLESVELRQSGFIFWLHDLSTPDPYWVLPILMGGTMLIQQRLNPAPMDPVQEKVMQIMPFAFTIFFGFFPSGLVLYWVVNNVLSIGQQWTIARGIERAATVTEGKP